MTTFKSLRELVTFKGGGTPSKQVSEYWNGDIPWASVKDFTSTSLSETQDFISHEGLRNSAANLIPKGHVIIPTRMALGKAAINTVDLAINQDLRALVPKVRLDTRFLLHAVLSLRDEIVKKGSGATVKGITQDELYKLEIALPIFDDQLRIAHVLGNVEKLITQRKQHLKELDNLLKGVFLKMFGDPKLNPQGFPVRRLSDFYVSPKAGTKCGPFGSALKKDELVESGVPVWNMDNIGPNGQMVMPFRMWITPNKYNDLSAYSVQDGDIIISRAGTVGKMCVARMQQQPAVISTNLIRIRFGPELRPLYFVSLMLYCKGRVGRLKTGADGSFTHMNTGVLDSLEFPYPSIKLQDEFGEIASKVEGVKSHYQRSLAELETLYSALSQQAFSAKLDLSNVPLPEIEPLEENTMVTNLLHADDENDTTIDLPDTDSMLEAFEKPEARGALITYWIEVYRGRLGTTPFSIRRFMAAAQTRLAELHPDNDFELGVSDYEYIKTWVFEALSTGTLTQAFDEAGNRIQLKAVQA